MAETEEVKKRNGKISLSPLKFDEAVKALLETQPKPKDNSSTSQKQEN